MKTLRYLLPCFLFLGILGCGESASSDEAVNPPNVVIIFTDDQGFGDLGAYGGVHVKTPELDRLAEDGVRFTNFRVAQAVCSASRAALLTGCYPTRLDIRGAFGPRSPHGLNPAEVTIAEMLGEHGYQTAMVGKWHLGNRPGLFPTDQGFDRYYGITYSHDMWGGHPEPHMARIFPRRVALMRDSLVIDSLASFTTLTKDYNQEAVSIINDHDPAAGPLMLYLAHSLPHVPLYEDRTYAPATGLGIYGDVIAEVDAGVGEIRRALAEKGMAENTLIVFSSDNGPWLSYGTHAGQTAGLREGKGTSFEGGVRVPLLTYLPGQTPSGKVSHAPLMSTDLLPSLAALTGASLPEARLDGHERLADFLGQSEGPSPDAYAIYWIEGLDAVVSANGRWKLHFPHHFRSLVAGQITPTDGVPIAYFQDSIGLALFDLVNDPFETTDVKDQHPEVVSALSDRADQFRREMGDTHTGVKGEEVRVFNR
ncbi:sulfatase-like hydrolase/transferase [Lewinella sp. W8]|uniref:sulfatase-like hydrolase/transferase n=1 Tax=Lewinella sp. W8 TaxID=2528208 RepID=UPI001564CD33|nr:sulfatase-like hydrolase/transferase [Lewinella sp. W8]